MVKLFISFNMHVPFQISFIIIPTLVHFRSRIGSPSYSIETKLEIMDFSQNRVLTFNQACEYLGFKKSYVYKLTSAGILPHSKPNGKSIFFDREKLETWMLSNARSSLIERKIDASTYVSTHLRTKKYSNLK